MKNKGHVPSQIARISISLLLLCSVTGCGQQPPSATTSQDEMKAELQLQQMLADKEQAQEQEEQARQAASEREAAEQAEAQKPHYRPEVLAAVAQPRKWAAIKIENTGIEAVFNSNWTNGQLNYRVALLGERPMIEQFMKWREFKINFNNQGGMPTFDFTVSPSDFHWDPQSTNGGIPTMETRGTVPCQLAQYENGVQWNLTWKE